jgi:S1-C subfamily serine protease
MKRQTLIRPLATVALIAAGAALDHGLTSPTSPPSAAAANTTPAATHQTVTGSAADAVAERAFALASPAVVYVDSVGLGSGSGVIYDTTGDIVTNAHVVSGAQKLTVTLSTGKTYTARLVGTDTADDLAVIHINATGLPAAHFATTGSYAVAQTVLAIGNPLDLKQSVTAGLISALGRTVQESNGAYLPNAIQTSAPINPGNSGGALVTLDGTVVGIPTLEATDPQNNNGGAAQGIGFAVPSDRVTYIARQLIASGKVAHTGRAYLGVAAVDAQQAQSLQGGGGYFGSGGGFGPGGQGSPTTPSQTGALVQNASGPAAQAGVQQGDVITAFNGTAITGEDDLLTALAHQKPGTTVTLTVDRNGSTSSVHVTLGELPANPS